MGGYALGRFLPMLLILMTVLGAFYPSIDMAAGEKERGTLETLLTAPVPADQIVTGQVHRGRADGLHRRGAEPGEHAADLPVRAAPASAARWTCSSIPLHAIVW
jgi:hypothetical protein